MAEKTYRMLRKDGTGMPLHWNLNLSLVEGMIECQMTKEEIDDVVNLKPKPPEPKPPEVINTGSTEDDGV